MTQINSKRTLIVKVMISRPRFYFLWLSILFLANENDTRLNLRYCSINIVEERFATVA